MLPLCASSDYRTQEVYCCIAQHCSAFEKLSLAPAVHTHCVLLTVTAIEKHLQHFIYKERRNDDRQRDDKCLTRGKQAGGEREQVFLFLFSELHRF